MTNIHKLYIRSKIYPINVYSSMLSSVMSAINASERMLDDKNCVSVNRDLHNLRVKITLLLDKAKDDKETT